MNAAGFTDIEVVSRNEWYKETAKAELARLKGPIGQKAASICAPATSKINCRAVIWARSQERKTQGHVHAISKMYQFKRCKSLIVIHRHDAVVHSGRVLVECSIGREWTVHICKRRKFTR